MLIYRIPYGNRDNKCNCFYWFYLWLVDHDSLKLLDPNLLHFNYGELCHIYFNLNIVSWDTNEITN